VGRDRIELLRTLYKKHPSLFADLRKAEGSLKDIFPDMPKLANTLCTALRAGILKELSSDKNVLPVEVFVPNITTRLIEEYAINRENAMEAVGIWAIVCGRATEDQITAINMRFTSGGSGNMNDFVAPALHKTVLSRTSETKDNDTRECPFCAETIKKKAKVCKHCKNNVEMMECPFCAEEIIKTSEICGFCEGRIKDEPVLIAGRYEIVTIDGDEVVKDHKTGLIWQRGSSNEISWDNAKHYAQKSRFGDFYDWRLPSIDELKTLMYGVFDEQQGGQQNGGPGENGFYWPKNVWQYDFSDKHGWFWSGSLHKETPQYAWIIRFSSGKISYYYKLNKCHTKLVRTL
jgi:hypothetical protein